MTMILVLDHRIRRPPRSAALAAGLLLALSGLVGPAASEAGETRCWIDKGALVASAAFGDIAGDFLIDLAAPVSQLNDTRAGMAGLAGSSATGTLAIAGTRLPGFTLAIADLDARTRGFDTVITGVLGADLWRRFTVEIDPAPSCRLRLGRGRGRGRRLARSARLFLIRGDGAPLVPAILADGTRVRTEDVAVGTAQWASRIDGSALSRRAGNAGGQTSIRLRAVEVAGRLFEQVPAETPGPAEPRSPTIIGFAVWSSWKLRLDIQDGWLDLAPAQ